ncbi:MAG: DEAD/DEAH box helicase [Deltaproteobacteria bacterium]|nr:DEAD/DEAH box helicase [Deltaproteobacteria bacterium]
MELALSPQGHLYLLESDGASSLLSQAALRKIRSVFEKGEGFLLLYLGGVLAQEELHSTWKYWRTFSQIFFQELCKHPDFKKDLPVSAQIPVPSDDFLEDLLLETPPMQGAEYLNLEILKKLWASLQLAFETDFASFSGNLEDYLKQQNPVFNLIGRICFHLAENKRDEQKPFAFLATYADRLSAVDARVQHKPLGKALDEYAKDHQTLLHLLLPIQKAAEKSVLLKRWVEEGKIYRPLLLNAGDTFTFLKEIPKFEASGVVVKVPNWWASQKVPRPQVSVKIGENKIVKLGADALLDFSMELSLNGISLSEKEFNEILKLTKGLHYLKGQWVEIDPEKLKETLDHWKKVQGLAAKGLLSYAEAMRLLSGVSLGRTAEDFSETAIHEWSQVLVGKGLEARLQQLKNPEKSTALKIDSWVKACLRPYQKQGIQWLYLLQQLGLGGCLADDMGLGKTLQVIAFLSGLKKENEKSKIPNLIVVPASLLANWKSEVQRFAPHLKVLIAHPSEISSLELNRMNAETLQAYDIILLSYAGLTRFAWAKTITWGVLVLDEAQAIKNPGSLQTKAAKELKSSIRLALTGTPLENSLTDLWSLFDFICPGLLGSSKAFKDYIKKMQEASSTESYAPLRSLIAPYLLRRLKTDKKIIQDLPEKTELKAYCSLSKMQTVLYEQCVEALSKDLERLSEEKNDIQRRGIILACLMRLKQLCNHPAQFLGDGNYTAEQSGKFLRLAEICEPILSRQEKVLIFTQFSEIVGPLDDYLFSLFKKRGVSLDGKTPIPKRKERVEAFQQEQGPPYFILSVKAGGTGLNLTAASHVIHFDRWWNPAVENQATDRAFRIGQKKNVLVHKFICRGTIEEKIDALIESKKELAENILEGSSQSVLTEMGNEELIKTLRLDIHRALGE